MNRGVLASIAVAACVSTVHANMGDPRSGGSTTGEVAGVAAITIAREELTIDLRPLARGGLVAVHAVYHLSNPTTPQSVDVVFAPGSDMHAFTATLDGAALDVTPLAGVSLPESWRTDHGRYAERVPVGFRMTIPSGAHDVAVRYNANTLQWRGGDPTIDHSFSYILAPARSWGGFGGLDVTVHVPDDWSAATTPALERRGSTLTGSFATVPADRLEIDTQAPHETHGLLTIAFLVLFILVLAAGGPWIWMRTKQRALTSLLVSMGYALSWSLALIATAVAGVIVPTLVIEETQLNTRGYGAVFAVAGAIFLACIVFIVGVIVSRVAARPALERDPDVPRL